MRTEKLRSDMPGLRLVGGTKSGDASKLYGPVRAGLTTSQATLNQQLTESLNSLEKKVATLESRFSEVCATLTIVTAHLVELGVIGIKPSPLTIEEEESK